MTDTSQLDADIFKGGIVFSPLVPKLGCRAPPEGHQVNLRGHEMINEKYC